MSGISAAERRREAREAPLVERLGRAQDFRESLLETIGRAETAGLPRPPGADAMLDAANREILEADAALEREVRGDLGDVLPDLQEIVADAARERPRRRENAFQAFMEETEER